MRAIDERGHIELSETRSVDDVRTGFTLFVNGDVVVAKITPCFENGKGALIHGMVNGVGFGTTELYVLRPRPEVDGKFLYYLTVDPSFRKRGEACMTGAAGQQRVPEEFIRDTKVSVPKLSWQRAIADYLDRETERLDTLVAEKERLLSLLGEKRQALITRVVTSGLSPDVPSRDAGIAWLGDIPVHWGSRKIAWLFRERDQRGCPDLPLLEVSLNSGVVPREFTGEKIESTAADYNSYKVAWKGDVVFNKMRMWQGAVGVAPVEGLVSPDYVVAEPTSPLSSDYGELLFRTPAFSAECARRSHGIVWDRLRLYWDGFREIEIPVPPLAEQTAIVDHVRARTSTLDELISAADTSVTLLQERRMALIAAAVTGQIDVPDVA